MELTQNSKEFISNHFGYTPEKVTIDNPDGTTSVAYLMGGREGFQPWPTKKVEAYVAWMQSPHKNELLKAVNNYPTYQVEAVK